MYSREEEAGLLYIEGAKAVSAGGDQLGLLAGHLILMVRGTEQYPGPMWPLRIVPPDGREIRLDRFIDYLRKPTREGLGLPSLYFLQQVLKASSNDGTTALDLVRKELAKEHVDLDAIADHERDTALLRRQIKETGRPAISEKGTQYVPLPKSGKDRHAAQLAQRRPDLAEQVRAGKMKLSAALIEAGIRKKLTRLEQIIKWLPKLDHDEIAQLMDTLLQQKWLQK